MKDNIRAYCGYYRHLFFASSDLAWNTRNLSLEAEEELKILGDNLRVARKRRKLSIQATADRLDVNPRVIIKIEAGDTTVSLGGLMQYLSFFHFARGISRSAAPEHDIEETLLEARKLRSRSSKKSKTPFTAKELDF